MKHLFLPTVLGIAIVTSFAACSSTNSSSTSPAGDAGGTSNPPDDGDASTVPGTEGGTTGGPDIPPPTACPTAKYKTLVVVGDSISDVGGSGGTTAQAPFYRTLLVKNDDTKYPEWKGFDLATCWGLDLASDVVKASVGGAVATVPSPNPGTDLGVLLNQITSLPATLPGPVLVVGTIGGNDVQDGLISVLTGTPAQVKAKQDAFVAGYGAALTELTKADRFGAGVKVDVLMTNIYDPSGGSGHFYYEPTMSTCPGALGFWPDNKETKTALDPWNSAMAAESAKHPGVKLLQLAAPFVAHAVSTPAATNWFFKDCIHPSTLGHNAIRGIFWAGMTTLP